MPSLYRQVDFGNKYGGLTTVGYQVRDNLGVTVIPRTTEGVFAVEGGIYATNFTVIDQFVGNIYWDTEDGSVINATEEIDLSAYPTVYVPVTPALNYAVNVDVLRSFKVAGSVIDLSAYSDAELEEFLAIAEFIVETYTGTIFYHITNTLFKFNGTGNQLLYFHHVLNFPLISASACIEQDPEGNTLYEFQPEDYVAKPWYLARNWRSDYSVRSSTSHYGNTWPKGYRNIVVTGNWGREHVPLVVKRATLLLAAEAAKPGSTGLSYLGDNKRKQKWEDYEVEYQTKSSKSRPGDSTGFEYVDGLLESFIVRPDLFLTPEVHIPQFSTSLPFSFFNY